MSGIKIGLVGNNFGKKILSPIFQTFQSVEVIHCIDKNWQKLVNDKNIDAIALAVPPAEAYVILKQTIFNKKHIFCEKPFCANLQQAEEIVSLLPNNLMNAIDFELCESWVIRTLKMLLRLGHFGQIQGFELNWNLSSNYSDNSWKWDATQGGGALHNFGSHIWYLLNWLFEESMKNISGEILPNIYFNTLVRAEIDFEKFQGKVNIDTETNCGSEFTLIIFLEEKNLILKNHTNKLENFSLIIEKNGEEKILYQGNNTENQDGRINLISFIVSEFIEGIKKTSSFLTISDFATPTFADGVEAHRWSDILIRGKK